MSAIQTVDRIDITGARQPGLQNCNAREPPPNQSAAALERIRENRKNSGELKERQLMALLPFFKRLPKAGLGEVDFLIDGSEFLLRFLNLLAHRLHVLGFDLLPMVIGFLKTCLRRVEPLRHRFRQLKGQRIQFLLQALVLVVDPGLKNLFLRDPAQIARQPEPALSTMIIHLVGSKCQYFTPFR